MTKAFTATQLTAWTAVFRVLDADVRRQEGFIENNATAAEKPYERAVLAAKIRARDAVGLRVRKWQESVNELVRPESPSLPVGLE